MSFQYNNCRLQVVLFPSKSISDAVSLIIRSLWAKRADGTPGYFGRGAGIAVVFFDGVRSVKLHNVTRSFLEEHSVVVTITYTIF